MAIDRVVNNQKITDMLQKIIQLDGTFIVDINKQVHYRVSPDDPINVGEGKVKRYLYIYDVNIQDPTASIMNPLSETSVSPKEHLLFYSGLSSSTSQWIMRVLKVIIERCVEAKADKNAQLDPKEAAMLTPFISKVDEKLYTELEKIVGAGHSNFASIYYNRLQKTSTLLMGVEDETGDYQKLFPNGHIRKRSWGIITDMIRHILQVPEDKKIKEVYTCSTEKVDCPKFMTFTDVWIRIWECLSPYMIWFADHNCDMETINALKEHFKNIPVYKECVSWLKQPSLSVSSVTPPAGTKSEVSTTVDRNTEPSWKITNKASTMIQVTPTKQPSWAITSNNFTPNSNPGFGRGTMIQVYNRRPW